jgi:hypothetical protein
MKRVLFSILLLSAACSKGDSKAQTTTPTGDSLADQDTGVPGDGSDGPDSSLPGGETEPADAPADGSAAGGTNLLVLPKDWSNKEVKGYMKQVAKGLGVQCSHCHDAANFASDAIPAKLAARKMIAMTRSLDEENFGGKGRVTCMTCHKGALEP